MNDKAKEDRTTVELFMDKKTQRITKCLVNGEEPKNLFAMSIAIAKINEKEEVIQEERLDIKLTQEEIDKGWKFGFGFHPFFHPLDDLLAGLQCGGLDLEKIIFHIVDEEKPRAVVKEDEPEEIPVASPEREISVSDDEEELYFDIGIRVEPWPKLRVKGITYIDKKTNTMTTITPEGLKHDLKLLQAIRKISYDD